ncbi:MAG: acetylxylan esterase [Trebonia sp.]
MPLYDLPLDQLRQYRTTTEEPAELDEWWTERLAMARALTKPLQLTRHHPDLYGVLEVYDAEFSGADGNRVKAWYIKPPEADKIVVRFIGYGGGRGTPSEHMLLPSVGYSLFVMDTRGQGGRWTTGGTGDGSAGPENSLVMTRGVTTPEDYYYTRLYTDAALAVDAALELSGGAPVAVSGASQGGGLSLAAAALQRENVALCHADVPFLCDIQRAVTFSPTAPYSEISEFLAQNIDLVDATLDTLRYIDCALLARRITATTLVSVGLMDTVCPPSTVFAAYNEITAGKDIAVHPFSQHGVPSLHVERQLRHLRENFPA